MPKPPAEKARGAGFRPDAVPDVVTRDEATARFREHLRLAPLGTETLPLHAGAQSRAGGRCRRRTWTFPASIAPTSTASRCRPSDTFGAMEETPRTVTLNDEVLAPGVAPTKDGGHRRRDADRNGRNAAARRRRGADGRAFGARRGRARQADGDPARAHRRRERELCRHGHRARRDGASRRRAPHLARDRRAGRRRARARSPSIAGREWRSSRPATRSSRPAIRCVPAPSTTPTPRSSARPSRSSAASPVHLGVIPDDESALASALARGLECDLVIFSGGTSKGEGDLSYRVVERLARSRRRRHGVALKPGKPICLAVTDGKPVVILPGISDVRDLHVPRIRGAGDPRLCGPAGRAPRSRGRDAARCASTPSGDEPSTCWSAWCRDRRDSPPIRWARARAR